MTKILGIALLATLLTGCSSVNSNSLPYDAWYLGFSTPAYMEAWIETAAVVDIQGRLFARAGSGITAMSEWPDLSADPRGWPKTVGRGAGRYVTGADLPEQIYVRWQSLVEPQTYQMVIKIPEKVRAMMRKKERVFCAFDGEWITDYREAISVRLAPGGIAKVWVTGPCLPAIEVATAKGVIDPRGPYEGRSEGKHRSLSPIPKAYVEKFGIPYDSWK